MNSPLASRRPGCRHCLRPQSACICRWVTPVPHRVEVCILQHPLEVTNAKGSARLLHLCLPRSRLLVGEVFDEQALRALLQAGDGVHTVLLYPETAQPEAGDRCERPAFDAARIGDPAQVRLVVLDGTWRKSRKMLHLNPLLRSLPRLPLSAMPPTQYRIRKAHGPDQLSTLEAVTYALMRLEGNEEGFLPLLAAFDGFVAQQCAYRTQLHE